MLKRTYLALGLLALIAFVVWLLFLKGCNSTNTPEHIETEEDNVQFVQDPNSPCPNDPLVMMNLAAPSPISGNSGALFGCRRYANTSCNLSVGDRPK